VIFIPLTVVSLGYGRFKRTLFKIAEQLRGPFEKFVDWRQCATVMLLCIERDNSGALPPVHELFKRPSYFREFYITLYTKFHAHIRNDIS
jgi:hypothetical protein